MIYRYILPAFLYIVSVTPAIAATEAEVFDFLKKHAPEVYKEMVRLKKEEPKAYKVTWPETHDARQEYLRVRDYNPEAAEAYLKMFRIDFDVVGYSDELVQATDAEKVKQLREKIKEQIGKSFDQWVIYERARLAQLQTQLDKTKQNFEKDAANKAKVVEHDTEVLIQQSRRYYRKK